MGIATGGVGQAAPKGRGGAPPHPAGILQRIEKGTDYTCLAGGWGVSGEEADVAEGDVDDAIGEEAEAEDGENDG